MPRQSEENGSASRFTALSRRPAQHYYSSMTKSQIESVLERVKTWPPERQEDAARVLLAMEAEDAGPYGLSPEERADLQAALAEAERGEFASDEEVAAVFSRFRQ